MGNFVAGTDLFLDVRLIDDQMVTSQVTVAQPGGLQ